MTYNEFNKDLSTNEKIQFIHFGLQTGKDLAVSGLTNRLDAKARKLMVEGKNPEGKAFPNIAGAIVYVDDPTDEEIKEAIRSIPELGVYMHDAFGNLDFMIETLSKNPHLYHNFKTEDIPEKATKLILKTSAIDLVFSRLQPNNIYSLVEAETAFTWFRFPDADRLKRMFEEDPFRAMDYYNVPMTDAHKEEIKEIVLSEEAAEHIHGIMARILLYSVYKFDIKFSSEEWMKIVSLYGIQALSILSVKELMEIDPMDIPIAPETFQILPNVYSNQTNCEVLRTWLNIVINRWLKFMFPKWCDGEIASFGDAVRASIPEEQTMPLDSGSDDIRGIITKDDSTDDSTAGDHCATGTFTPAG